MSPAAREAAAVDRPLAERLRRARHDPALAVLEGFHALKHALRFGGEPLEAYAGDPDAVARLAGAVAPDVRERVAALVRPIAPEVLAELAPRAPHPAIVSVARRPAFDLAQALADPRPSPVVLLEDPRNMGNLGACVRVAAGADAAAVLSTGTSDPWHPDALRGAAGLHYALPVARVDGPPPPGDRPLVALDPEGDPLDATALPSRAVLAFGSERHGLSDTLLHAADARVRIPMRAGVSSLNLATSVAVVLFAARLRDR
jgi:TrmH family RNA methyltransferase